MPSSSLNRPLFSLLFLSFCLVFSNMKDLPLTQGDPEQGVCPSLLFHVTVVQQKPLRLMPWFSCSQYGHGYHIYSSSLGLAPEV